MGLRRTHDFTGVPRELVPTLDDALDLIDRIDADAEVQRMRLIEVFDWLETAVTEQVRVERRADEAEVRLAAAEQRLCSEQAASSVEMERLRAQIERSDRELQAMRDTKLFRAAAPFRRVYARVRHRA